MAPTPRRWSVLAEERGGAARSPHIAQRRAPRGSRDALRWPGRAWDRNASPLTISFQAMRAVLLASATAASLGGLRLSSSTSQGEGWPLSAPHLLDHRGGTDHQDAAQGLVAGAGDHAQPRLAGGGVILRRQSDPCREVPAATEKREDRAPSSPAARRRSGRCREPCAIRRLSSLSLCQAISLASIALRSHLQPRHILAPGVANSSLASRAAASSSAMRASSGSILSSPLAATSPNSAA